MDETTRWERKGRAWKFGDNILNDGGIASLEMIRQGVFDPAILGRQCLVDVKPGFPSVAKSNDIIVAGKNFGKGQLHMTGPLAIKGTGCGLITASMTRAFFRLSVSAGLVMLPFAGDIIEGIDDGDELEVDFRTGVVENLTQRTTLRTPPLPDFLQEFIEAGGEMAWFKQNHRAS